MPGEATTITSIDLPFTSEQGWPAQGRWTYDDYLRLPDDGRRYEIIKLGEFAGAESLTSKVLAGFSLAINTLFASR